MKTAVFYFVFITAFSAGISIGSHESNVQNREKRQLGLCSWGQPAVSSCFQSGYCNLGYQCDMAAGGDGRGRCCLANANPNPNPNPFPNPNPNPNPGGMPNCRDGNPAVAGCMSGGLCGNGLVCSRSDNLCCLSGTSASCNFAGFPSGRCPNGYCANGQQCSQDGYCCPPGSGTGLGNQCPNGGVATGQCNFAGQQCTIAGQQCINGLCCPITGTGGVCPFNAPSAPGSCNANFPCQQGYVCIQNRCCLLSVMRCNNGVTPLGACIGIPGQLGQCPQTTPQGVFQPQQCEQQFNLCCPI